ncbi:hypothetical protein CCS79_03030 [Clostridium diolis]|uniref:hypothetical protein n=1 Tax=Clostridium diolis TaxID=223919 RepID=UPI000B3F81EF|nr:hypothetical protein [Clostridium diolis]OVE69999.1 hypothetical protein CCS79_03030 [Clostridium diolis]
MRVEKFLSMPLFDRKIDGKSWMTIITIREYLSMVDMDNNPYQRNKLGIKSYKKLIEDLLNDTVIPPISVVFDGRALDLSEDLNATKKFIILDGLQRTNCMIHCKNLLEENESSGCIKTVDEFLEKKIYVEIWEKLNLQTILYKMLVLNTGQQKMDYSHQLDILNESVRYELEANGINVITRKEIKEGRPKTDCFQLSDVTEGLVSFIHTLPMSGKKDAAEFLFERFNVGLNSGEDTSILALISDKKTYKYLIWTLSDFNNLLNDCYGDENPLMKYNVFLISFLASLGYSLKKNSLNLEAKINILVKKFEGNPDPLRLSLFEQYYNKFRTGIGEKRRKFVYEVFRDYFISNEYKTELEWDEVYERYF